MFHCFTDGFSYTYDLCLWFPTSSWCLRTLCNDAQDLVCIEGSDFPELRSSFVRIGTCQPSVCGRDGEGGSYIDSCGEHLTHIRSSVTRSEALRPEPVHPPVERAGLHVAGHAQGIGTSPMSGSIEVRVRPVEEDAGANVSSKSHYQLSVHFIDLFSTHEACQA